ncbi:MAG: hypothetical protein PSW75_11435 [bacterium]|nr:hypothetical protein [bacterium]
MRRLPFWLATLNLGLALLAPATVVAATKAAAPATKGSPVASPKASPPETDAGAKDPADFPRASGLVRKSYSQDPGRLYDTEIATYHAQAAMDTVAAYYLEQLQTAGWKKVSDAVSGSDMNRLRMIEWHTPAKEAEVRFYAAKGGGSDLRVRIFTFKTTRPTAADIAPATATPAQAAASNAAAKSKALGAAPLGPPPTGFKIQSDNAYEHNLSWSDAGSATCDIYRVDSSGGTQVANHITAKKFSDRAFLEPNTLYRLVVHYADGREGNLEYTYVNPPQPLVVTDLQAVLSGPGKHKLTWKQTSYYEVYWQPKTNPPNIYQVYGPTLPAEGLGVSTNSIELTDVPVGNQSVRVALLYGYGDPPQWVPAPKVATVNFDVLPDRGRYRIVFLGLQCWHESKDDPLQLDGKRDEVYAGAYTVRVARYSSNVTPASGSFARTKVMGDTNGFPYRLQAGTASDKGGIQTNDFVPDATITTPKPGVVTASDRFPLLVWEGELRDSSDLLVIAPVLFSWNKDDDGPWSNWTGWWSSPNGSAQLRDSARQGVKPDKLGVTLSGEWQRDKWAGGYIDPLAGSFDFLDPDRKRRYGPGFDLKADRPIGLEDQHGSGVLNVPDLVWAPRGLVLTRTNLEAKLGGKVAVVYSWAFIDESSGNTNAALEGEYYLHIQIERLPSPQ